MWAVWFWPQQVWGATSSAWAHCFCSRHCQSQTFWQRWSAEQSRIKCLVASVKSLSGDRLGIAAWRRKIHFAPTDTESCSKVVLRCASEMAEVDDSCFLSGCCLPWMCNRRPQALTLTDHNLENISRNHVTWGMLGRERFTKFLD